MIKIALVMFLLASTVLCYAESEQLFYIKNGFLTGNSFRELSYAEKCGYAMGFLDGVFMSPMFHAPKKELEWIERCVTGMNERQVVAILEKFLNENPARWHESMNVLAWVAMKEACKK
jgi:hypothetical protein